MNPTFPEALLQAEQRLTRSLGRTVTLTLRRSLNPHLLQVIEYIDSQKFRPDLRYSREEINRHSNELDYTAILAEGEGTPLGVSYGYKEPDGDGYLLDTLASIVEGAGVGSALATLTIIYATERGYPHLTLYTEELDERGRNLRRWYQRLGFTFLGIHQGKGDVMTITLTREKAAELYTRHITTTQP